MAIPTTEQIKNVRPRNNATKAAPTQAQEKQPTAYSNAKAQPGNFEVRVFPTAADNKMEGSRHLAYASVTFCDTKGNKQISASGIKVYEKNNGEIGVRMPRGRGKPKAGETRGRPVDLIMPVGGTDARNALDAAIILEYDKQIKTPTEYPNEMEKGYNPPAKDVAIVVSNVQRNNNVNTSTFMNADVQVGNFFIKNAGLRQNENNEIHLVLPTVMRPFVYTPDPKTGGIPLDADGKQVKEYHPSEVDRTNKGKTERVYNQPPTGMKREFAPAAIPSGENLRSAIEKAMYGAYQENLKQTAAEKVDARASQMEKLASQAPKEAAKGGKGDR